MTLGFKTKGPNGPTLFPEKILLPYDQEIQYAHPDLLPKIHTFRTGQRWRAGMAIQMVTGNRTKHRHQFNIGIPELQTCISVQDADITLKDGGISIELIREHMLADDRLLTPEQVLLFAVNDGFNSLDELIQWFFPDLTDGVLVGQIIHWTDLKY